MSYGLPMLKQSPESTETTLPDQSRTGRGGVASKAGLLERLDKTAIDDGWRSDASDDPLPRLDTTVSFDKSKSVIARNDSLDIAFDRSINPYRGWEHG
jgi:hypothetical protein